MHPIASPFSRNIRYKDEPEGVANLQDALVFLLAKEPTQFVFSSSIEASKLSQEIEREAALGSFGAATEEALKGFQRASELEDSGEVDEWTAFSLNAVLLRWVLSCNPLQRVDLALSHDREVPPANEKVARV